jgi:hypothetical protein
LAKSPFNFLSYIFFFLAVAELTFKCFYNGSPSKRLGKLPVGFELVAEFNSSSPFIPSFGFMIFAQVLL